MKTTVIGKKILVAVPFEKKDEFKKAMNGNAKWDSAAKAWYVEKTEENEILLNNYLNKDEKEIEAMNKRIENLNEMINFTEMYEIVKTMKEHATSNSSSSNTIYKLNQEKLIKILDELDEYGYYIPAIEDYKTTKFYRASFLDSVSMKEVSIYKKS